VNEADLIDQVRIAARAGAARCWCASPWHTQGAGSRTADRIGKAGVSRGDEMANTEFGSRVLVDVLRADLKDPEVSLKSDPRVCG
jgi:hypothetical protein